MFVESGSAINGYFEFDKSYFSCGIKKLKKRWIKYEVLKGDYIIKNILQGFTICNNISKLLLSKTLHYSSKKYSTNH